MQPCSYEHREEGKGEDQVPRSCLGGAEDPPDDEVERSKGHHDRRQHGGARSSPGEQCEPEPRHDQDEQEAWSPADREVAEDAANVPRQLSWSQSAAIFVRSRPVALGQSRIGQPQRRCQNRDRKERQAGSERRDPLPAPPSQDEGNLRCHDEGAEGVRGDGCQRRRHPRGPAQAVSALEGSQEREVRERRRQQKEGVHAPENAVEEEHPARRREDRRDEPDLPTCESVDEGGDRRHGSDCAGDRHEA